MAESSQTGSSLTAREFEDICLYRMRQEEEAGRATMSRYGVQASMFRDQTGQMVWQPKQSLPDFEGVLPPLGRQFVTDCKVCGAASFPLHDEHFKERQLRHLLLRADFGAIAFLTLHFAERQLKTKHDPAATWAFPVFRTHPLWLAFDRLETKRITREDCEEYARPIHWNTFDGGRKPRPDLLSAIRELEFCWQDLPGQRPKTSPDSLTTTPVGVPA